MKGNVNELNQIFQEVKDEHHLADDGTLPLDEAPPDQRQDGEIVNIVDQVDGN